MSASRPGSLAALERHSSPKAALGCIAVVQPARSGLPYLNVCFSQKRSFKPRLFHDFERLLSANSGLKNLIFFESPSRIAQLMTNPPTRFHGQPIPAALEHYWYVPAFPGVDSADQL